MKKLKFKTIILSDVHLGTADCKIKEVNRFLKHSSSERIILNGDIIDGWQLRRGSRWTKHHSRFIRIVLKKIEKKDTEVIYLRGNHDDVLRRFLPLSLDNLKIVEDYIHRTPRGNYLVVHGDIFDLVTRNFVILAHIGDYGYRMLLALNRIYNRWRTWRGREYFSLSKVIKARVKSAVSFVSNFEEQLVKMARSRKCQGVICGHIHTPADKMIEDIHYLNSGDWVESLTAIVEEEEGTMRLIDYETFCRELDALQESAEDSPAEREAITVVA